jgi:SAM-dependent methyltransferase
MARKVIGDQLAQQNVVSQSTGVRYNLLLDAAGIDRRTQMHLDAVRLRIADRASRAVEQFGEGAALEIGSGTGTFSDEFHTRFSSYITLDYEARSSNLQVQGDGQSLPFGDQSFNTVISIDVLEHVQHPWQMFSEIKRVLVPGGRLILITPFFFWAHEEPYDFFRVSRYGLLQMCQENGMQVLKMEPTCGFVASLGLLTTVALTRLLYRIPPVLVLVLRLSHLVQKSLLLWVDDRVDRSKRFAQGHLLVAAKL